MRRVDRACDEVVPGMRARATCPMKGYVLSESAMVPLYTSRSDTAFSASSAAASDKSTAAKAARSLSPRAIPTCCALPGFGVREASGSLVSALWQSGVWSHQFSSISDLIEIEIADDNCCGKKNGAHSGHSLPRAAARATSLRVAATAKHNTAGRSYGGRSREF